jgi:hypothetical protein
VYIENFDVFWKEFNEINKSIWNLEKKHKTVNPRIKNKSVFTETTHDRAFRMDYRYHAVLLILLKNPKINLNNIVLNYLQLGNLGKPKNFDTIRLRIMRIIKELSLINYISPLRSKSKEIGNIKNKLNLPYELSLGGIFYLVINRSAFNSKDIWHFLMQNYPDNKLFQCFIYPYFDEGTLSKLDPLHPLFIIYLEEVCNFLKYQTQWADKDNRVQKGYVEYYLFSWDTNSNTRGNSNFPKDRWMFLRRYLEEKYEWKWVQESSIHADYSNNKIIIKDVNTNSEASLHISQTEKKAKLRFNGKIYDDFLIRKSKHSLEIFGKSYSLQRLRNISFRNGLLRIIALFLLNINLEYLDDEISKNSDMNKILSQDEKFIKITKEIAKVLHSRIEI